MSEPAFQLEDFFTFKQNFVSQFLASYAVKETSNFKSLTAEIIADFPIKLAERMANKAWQQYCETHKLI